VKRGMIMHVPRPRRLGQPAEELQQPAGHHSFSRWHQILPGLVRWHQIPAESLRRARR